MAVYINSISIYVMAFDVTFVGTLTQTVRRLVIFAGIRCLLIVLINNYSVMFCVIYLDEYFHSL